MENVRQEGMNLKLAAAKFSDYSLKSLKIHDTRNGYAFSAKLYKGTTLLGQVWQDGNGGSTDLEIRAEDRAQLKAHCATLPPYKDTTYPELPELEYSDELFIDELVGHTELIQKLKRTAKLNTFFTLVGGKEGEYLVIKRPFTPETKKMLEAKYGNQLECIMNEALVAL